MNPQEQKLILIKSYILQFHLNKQIKKVGLFRFNYAKKKRARLHQNHEYLVRDLPQAEHQVDLKVNRRQLKCAHGKKPFSEKFDFVEKTRTYTKRLAEKVISEVIESDVKNVAERNGLSEKEVETILKEKFADLKTQKPLGLKKLGIDEIAWVKGHKNPTSSLSEFRNKKARSYFREKNSRMFT